MLFDRVIEQIGNVSMGDVSIFAVHCDKVNVSVAD